METLCDSQRTQALQRTYVCFATETSDTVREQTFFDIKLKNDQSSESNTAILSRLYAIVITELIVKFK
jgi:hypothetical protein